MSAAILLRDDFDGPELRALAKVSRDPVQVRRLLALAEIYDGSSRSVATRVAGSAFRVFETGCFVSTSVVREP